MRIAGTGAGVIARLTGLPVVPVGLFFTNKFPWIKQAQVLIGKPLYYARIKKTIIPRKTALATAHSIMRAIAQLCNKRYKQ